MNNLKTKDIPGPQGPELIFKIGEIQRNPLQFMLNMVTEYGNFVQFPIGQMMVYLVNQPQYVKQILLDNHHNYSKNTIQYNQLARVTGRGLLTSDGYFWLRQRRLAQPAFHKARIESLDHVIVDSTAQMLSRWKDFADSGEPVDIDQEMMRLTLRIVGRALFSIDLQEQAREFTQAVLTALDHIVYRSQNIFALPESIPTPRNLRFRRALDVMDELVYRMIADRRREISPPQDLLTMFLEAREAETGAGMSDTQIRDEVMTILIAGHETVASALTWCFYLLAKNPDVQTELECETRQRLANQPPSRDSYPSLDLARAIFEETLRLYPPAWLITRRSEAGDSFGTYRTPPNSLFIISPYVLHRNPACWEKPEKFSPQRFQQGKSPTHRFDYIPFGAGPRQCIGDRMALYEAVLILSQISQHYRLKLSPDEPVDLTALVTLRPRHGLNMLLTKI